MIIHTGGAIGTDMLFEYAGLFYGHQVKAFSFEGHETKSHCRIILEDYELKKAHKMVLNARGDRHFPTKNAYTNNLIYRDYYIVKDATFIVAIGYMEGKTLKSVSGGTYWGVNLTNKPTLFFNLNTNSWFPDVDIAQYIKQYIRLDRCGIKEAIMAGIGTRNIKFHETKVREVIMFVMKILEECE